VVEQDSPSSDDNDSKGDNDSEWDDDSGDESEGGSHVPQSRQEGARGRRNQQSSPSPPNGQTQPKPCCWMNRAWEWGLCGRTS
jgi:hypothetical protein